MSCGFDNSQVECYEWRSFVQPHKITKERGKQKNILVEFSMIFFWYGMVRWARVACIELGPVAVPACLILIFYITYYYND